MVNHNVQRFLVLLALVFAFQFGISQQRAKIVDMPGSVEIDIKKELLEDVDWGDLNPGTMMRSRLSIKNTESHPINVLRVVSAPGCFTAGVEGPLRDVSLAPGETVDFYVISSVQEPGQYTLKNEVIIEMEGKRYRRGVFNYTGFVNEITGDF